MAISEDKKRLFTTVKDGKKIGISLWEIMACLGYYKRDKNGRRNLGMIIKNATINPYSKYKPIDYGKDGALTDNDRAMVDWGMFVDGKYWRYKKPTSQYRVLDFDGYNHDAEAPIAPTSKFDKTLDLDIADAYLKQEIVIYPSGVLAYGENVELPLNNLTAYPYTNYLGLVFENRNSGAKWFHSFDFTLEQMVEKTWTIDQSYFPPLKQMPNTNNGDVVDVWYCLVSQPNVEYGQVGNNMIYFAMDETHGHFQLKIQRFTLSSLGIYKPFSSASTINFSYSGSSATVNRILYDCQLNYQTANQHFEVGTQYQFYVNGSAVGSKVEKVIRLEDVQNQGFEVAKAQSVTISAATLEANDYNIEVECRANLVGNSDYKVVMKYMLNVQTGEITHLI